MMRLLIGFAAVASIPSAQMMEMPDTDHDGFISYGEHQAWGAHVFQTMDKDGSGLITRAEFMAARMDPGTGSGTSQSQINASAERGQTRKAELFTTMDKDNDGLVGGVEFFIKLGDGFMSLDKNKDGRISVAEFSEWHRGW